MIGVPGDGTHRTWKVAIGSGRGLIASGDLSDGAFTAEVELKTVLRNEFRRRFGVRLYYRFNDDICAAIAAEHCFEVANIIMNLSRCFRMKCEDIVRIQRLHDEVFFIPFLDVEVTAVPSPLETGYILQCRPYKKPTSLWLPLSHTSLHSPGVHLGWPTAYLRRLYDRSSCDSYYEEASRRFITEMRIHAPLHPWSDLPLVANRPRTRESGISYLVLPWSLEWHRARITMLITEHDQCFIDLGIPRCRISWSLAGSHSGKLLGTITHPVGGRSGGRR